MDISLKSILYKNFHYYFLFILSKIFIKKIFYCIINNLKGCVEIMQVWEKVKVNKIDRQTALLSNALTNYIYKEGPIVEIFNKYNITREDRDKLDYYTASRIAGLLLLYYGQDVKRINDIANRYNYIVDIDDPMDIKPEIEGYITKKRANKKDID